MKECILFLLLLLLHNISNLNEISMVIDKRKGTDIIAKNYFSLVSEVIVNGKSTTIENYTSLLNNKLNNITIKFTEYLTSARGMFFYLENIISMDLWNFYSSALKDTSYMFEWCFSLKSLNISNFNTSSVKSMAYMFYSLYPLKSLDVSNFDTSSVTLMDYMFGYCRSLTTLNLNNFNTSLVKDMTAMFYMCESLISLKIDNFDTSSVTNIDSMFSNCSSLISLNLTNFDLESSRHYDLFKGCNEEMKYCIDDNKEYDKDIIEFLKDFEKNCSEICITYNSQKFIIEKNKCLDKCSMDNQYKYEYGTFCYEKCPNNTESTGGNYICKIIDKNKKDSNDKTKIWIITGIIIGSIFIIISIILIIYYLRRKKHISQKYNPLVNNDDLITFILTTVEQQLNLPITCKKTDIVKDVLVKELSKEYSKYLKLEYYIICNGTVVDNNKSFEENNIKDKDILILNEQEFQPIIGSEKIKM